MDRFRITFTRIEPSEPSLSMPVRVLLSLAGLNVFMWSLYGVIWLVTRL